MMLTAPEFSKNDIPRHPHPWPARWGAKILAIELKSEKGKTSPLQKRWLMAFEQAGVYSAVWKPSDMEYVLYMLSNPHQ